jgi:hypothetical protein
VLLVCIVAGLAAMAGCGEEESDYSILKSGDIPRPEFEFILDFDYWLDSFGKEDFIDPMMWDFLEKAGITSLVRTNLVAYERDDHIAVECRYGLDDTEDKITGRILSLEPPVSKLLGRMDNDSILMSIYFSNGRETLKTFAKNLSDPFMVDALFGGDRNMAVKTKGSLLMNIGMIEGAILRHFKDECLFAMFPVPGYPSEEAGIPVRGILIIPTYAGQPVAYDIANLFKSFGYLASVFSEELKDISILDFQETEVDGYPCVYLELGSGEAISMVDADGYLFVGGYQGILAALEAFHRGEQATAQREPVNAYCYVNYSLFNTHLLQPLYEAVVDPGGMNILSPLPIADIYGPFIKRLIVQISELTEDAGETIWADFSLRNDAGEFEIKVRMQTGLAEHSLENLEASMEVMEQLLQDM